jgi:hypothetical protein
MQQQPHESEAEAVHDDAGRWLGRTKRRRGRIGARTYTLAGLGFGGLGTLGLAGGYLPNDTSNDSGVSK